MSDVTIKHLRAFLAVARFRSFTKASEEIHVSQPALTMAIRQLEDIVGASLLDRTTRAVSLTPEGTDFYPTAERLLCDFDLALQDVRAAADRRRKHIGVACVHSVATKLLPPALRRFSRESPGVSMHLHDGNSSDVRLRVRRNEVDIGFGSRDTGDPELTFAPLFRDQMGLFARADHPLFKRKRTLRWNDLTGHDFVGLTEDTATRPILEAIPALPDTIGSPRYMVSNNATLWAMLEAGIGITTSPALAPPSSKHFPLRFRPLIDPIAWRTVYTITRKGRALSPAALEFAEVIKSRVHSIAKSNALVECLDPASPS